jgi:hypothetical protein
MNRTLRMLVAALLAASLLPIAALAQTESGGSPGSWLSGYAGARTVGMGGAFVATADDALGVLWNPAGLQWMDQNQAMFESVRLFEDTSINSLSFALPGSRFPSLVSGLLGLRDHLGHPLLRLGLRHARPGGHDLREIRAVASRDVSAPPKTTGEDPTDLCSTGLHVNRGLLGGGGGSGGGGGPWAVAPITVVTNTATTP